MKFFLRRHYLKMLIPLAAFIVWSCQADDLGELLDAVDSIPADEALEFGRKIEAELVRVGNDSVNQQRIDERRLLDTLATAKTREAKSLLCRLLRRIGSEQSIPVLRPMLVNEEIGHMARFALAGIPGDNALAAMREALPEVSENLQIGLMNTLAQRRDHEALDLFVERAQKTSLPLASSAIRALGLLGSLDAVNALDQQRTRVVDSSLLREIDHALLTAAERLLAAGERQRAREIYLRFMRSAAAHERLAGLSGLAKIGDAEARVVIDGAMTDSDPAVQRTALWLVLDLSGDSAARLAAKALPGLSPTLQPALIDWLGENGEAASRDVLNPFLQSDELEHRVAAIRALGRLGDSETVPILLERLTSDERRIREAAEASLRRLPGDEVDRRLGSMLIPESKLAVDIIEILADRNARSAYPALVTLSRDGDGDVRKAAIKALGNLATAEELPALVALLSEPGMREESKSVQSAILSAFRQVSRPEDRAAPLLSALEDEAAAPVRTDIINLLGRAGSKEALVAVRLALKSQDSAVRNAAVQTLARWPSDEPLDDLHQLAKTAEEKSHRVVALRGFVAMAKNREDAPVRYAQALELAESPEATKLVLSGLGQTDSLEAIDLCQDLLDDDAVAAEAALACVQISRRAWRKDREKIQGLMESLVEHEDEAVRAGAKRVLERIVR